MATLLLFLPLTLAGELAHWSPVVVFILACIAIIPMAAYIGAATESLAHFTGPRVGGLLNATLGNAAELIITIAAIRASLLDLVKASITGSILGNLLLVMGFAFVVGGTRHGRQKFNRTNAARHAILLVLAVLAMLIPSLFSGSIGPSASPRVEWLTIGVAIVMIALYALGLVDAARSPESSITYTEEPNPSRRSQWTLPVSIVILVAATVGIAWLSEVLVGVVEPVVADLGVSEFFLGIILIPIIGNAAEHLVAVQFAHQNKMDLSVEIAISSSLQVALMVAPLLVFLSLAFGHPLQLIFNPLELLALIAGVIIAVAVSSDGESTWLEGATLIGIYLILSLAFFLLPV
jgi:Ca2+:H+ antiporter